MNLALICSFAIFSCCLKKWQIGKMQKKKKKIKKLKKIQFKNIKKTERVN